MKPSFYLAAPWTHRETAAGVAGELVQMGYRLTHDWWAHEAGDEDTTELARLARLDFIAVMGCDIFILLNLEKSEGKAIESGLALSRYELDGPHPDLIGVGHRGSNIFQYLPVWEWYPTITEMLMAMGRTQK